MHTFSAGSPGVRKLGSSLVRVRVRVKVKVRVRAGARVRARVDASAGFSVPETTPELALTPTLTLIGSKSPICFLEP